MFDAGAIVFNIKTAGAQVFRQELSQADKAAKDLGASAKTTARDTEDLGKKQDTTSESAKRQRKSHDENAKAQHEAAEAARTYADAQQTVGRGLVTAGAAIVAVTALTVKSAVEWESAWAGVTKTIDASDEELAQIEVGLRGLSKVLPASHDEIAAVAEAAGQLGVAAKDVVSFTRTMVDLGETTNLTSDEAATAIAQLMNIMQTAPEDVDRLGSALVALGNNGASTEKDIILMAQRIAGAGKIIGLTEAEVLSFANALASAGIDVEAGGSAISRIMTDIAKQVSTNGKDLEKWASVAGMSADEFAAKFKEAPAEAINDFILGLGRMNAAGGDVFTTLEDLGQSDIRVSNALLAMANAGDLLTGSLETGTKAWEDNNALQTEAAKRYETVESKLQITRNTINDAAIDLGSVFLPVLVEVLSGVANLADGIASLPTPVQEFLVVGGLAIGVITLMGGAALIAVPQVVQFRAALALLAVQSPNLTTALKGTATFLTGPWGIALAAAVVGALALEEYLDSLKASTEEYQNVIQNAKSVDELFKVADKGRLISELSEATESVKAFKDTLNTISTNDFLTGFSLPAQQLRQSLRDLGSELATTAGTDLPAAQRAFALMSDEMDLNSEQQQQLLDSMGPYKDALIEQATALGINVTSADEAANATELLKLAQGEGAEQSTAAADAYVQAADEVKGLTEDLDQLIELMNEANGIGQDAVSTNASYQESLAGISAEVKQQKEAYAEANGTLNGYTFSLDETTASGAANASMLADVAAKAQEAAGAQYELDKKTMSGKDATDKYITTLATSRQSLIDQAIANGATATEVQKLADKVFALPPQREIDILAETATAQRDIDNFVVGNSNRVINMILKYHGQDVPSVRPPLLQENGGVVDFFANGGMREDHRAQIARAGDWRVWAEPETGGEAYIPLSMAKRSSSVPVLAEAASRLGFDIVPQGAQRLADGGVTGAPAIRRPSGPMVIEGTLDLGDGLRGVVKGIVRDSQDELYLDMSGGSNR